MKILKKNQLILVVISIILITAGYLNFTANIENKEIETSTIANEESSIGDAKLVSTIVTDENTVISEENVTSSISDSENISEEVNLEQETAETEVMQEAQETNAEVADEYFVNSKLERSSMYSELLESYQEMYNNSNATAEQKQTALEEITKINSTKNSVMVAENLLEAKGFNELVIFVNDGSVSVIVKAEELQPEQIAQIQNIISRELGVGAECIHISTK